MILKRCRRANIGCLFAELSHVKTNSALPLRRIEHLICLVDGDHRAVHLLEFVIWNKFFIPIFIDDFTLFIHNSEAFDLFVVTLEVHIRGKVVCE